MIALIKRMQTPSGPAIERDFLNKICMDDKLLNAWLAFQSGTLEGVHSAISLLVTPDNKTYRQAATWPPSSRPSPVLSTAASTALSEKRCVIWSHRTTSDESGTPVDVLACPLSMKGQVVGSTAFAISSRSETLQREALLQLTSGTKWLEALHHERQASSRDQLINLVELVAASLEHENSTAAATDVVTEIADRFSCKRVSIGFLRGNVLHVAAISHSASFDRKSNLLRVVSDAMHECIDQAATVVYPPRKNMDYQATRVHAEFAASAGGASLCTVPLSSKGKVTGALLLERQPGRPFTATEVEHLEQIGLLIGSVLDIRSREERPFFRQTWDAITMFFSRLAGSNHPRLKIATALSLVLITFLALASGDFRIVSDAVLEPTVLRSIVAPQKGYIAEAYVRAGDIVSRGDVLLTLDDKDLLLEQRRFLGQEEQYRKEYRSALAGYDRVQVAITKARIQQVDAQLALIDKQLARTKLVAPIDGLVVSGDLSQSLGSPIERGDVLFEVAPLESYRVVLKTDERDIVFITTGQKGSLTLAGLPNTQISLTVEKITPVTIAEEGRNYFRIEALMDLQSDLLRPGMGGIAKIEVGRRKLIWIWSRRLVDWFSLWTWAKLP